MSKTTLYRIAQAIHQPSPDHREERRKAIWAETAKAKELWDMERRLFDLDSWEEGDDSIIF